MSPLFEACLLFRLFPLALFVHFCLLSCLVLSNFSMVGYPMDNLFLALL